MRRHKVVLREEAIADLAEIYRYIARASGSPVTAIRFVRRIRSRCQRIGNVPTRCAGAPARRVGGTARDDPRPGLRIVAFEHSAVIAYLVEDGQVCITNVFYGGRDYEALYRGVEAAEPDHDD